VSYRIVKYLLVLTFASLGVAANIPVKWLPQVPPGGWPLSANCGPTSVLMVASYYAGTTPTSNEIELIDQEMLKLFGYPVNSDNGTDAGDNGTEPTGFNLATLASEYFNLPDSHRYANWTIAQLQEELANRNPVIVAVFTHMSPADGYHKHFMVLVGMDDNFVYVNDPGRTWQQTHPGPLAYKLSDFKTAWKENANNAVVVIHPNQPLPPLTSAVVAIDPGVLGLLTENTYPYTPYGLAVDGSGNLYVAEPTDDPYQIPNGRVIKLPTTGGAQLPVGTGWSNPLGVAVDSLGDLYVADCSKVEEIAAISGMSRTIGSGLVVPCAVGIDSVNNIYIVEEGLAHSVLKVAPNGSQTTVGIGIGLPFAISVDPSNNVYVVDYTNNDVVKIPANGGSQTRLGSGLSSPYGVLGDPSGNVFITDVGNNRVVEVLAASGNQINIPIVGLLGPRELAMDASGVLYVSEFYGGPSGGYVLSLNRNEGFINFGAQGMGTVSTQVVTITNQGTAMITFQNPPYGLTGDTSDFNVQPAAVNGCNLSAGGTVAAGASCGILITFTPATAGIHTAALTLYDNAANPAPQVINMVGTACASVCEIAP
jgi:sugar lactone lactonase YvrE/uncharacterized protein YvpB